MTFASHSSEETMFDEKTIDGSIAHIQIEVVFDVAWCDKFDSESLNMLDNLARHVIINLAFSSSAADLLIHIITIV